ncbi:uncharacterized protein V1516DRAFT_676123 [Lipomyces oligophaga]|uniref:uncharacterized protein n=1 Tax=Lipomyces oligophaga TaxID=45792 RepID=UPI0034CD2503
MSADQSQTDPVHDRSLGLRKNGKSWKDSKQPKRVRSLGIAKTSWKAREKDRQDLENVKQQQQLLLAEKASTREQKVKQILQARKDKLDRERYAKLELTMNRKRIERLKRKEKRNKLLKER